MIKMRNINKVYGKGSSSTIALQNVNLDILKGESVAIMGKSGSGKTTLLNIIGGLDKYTSGEYTFLGNKIDQTNDGMMSRFRNEFVGIIMQDYALINDKSVLFNTMLPLYFDKTPKSQMKQKALDALERVGVSHLASRQVNQLSGGQKQRVAISRAIVKKPVLLLADEPTGSLDTQTSKEIMDMLMSLNRIGTTLLVVTHDVDIATYCNRTIYLSDGKISQ